MVETIRRCPTLPPKMEFDPGVNLGSGAGSHSGVAGAGGSGSSVGVAAQAKPAMRED